MLIKVNGVNEEVIAPLTLKELLESKNQDLTGIIILHNDSVVNRSEWPTIDLQESDVIEILKFLGGG